MQYIFYSSYIVLKCLVFVIFYVKKAVFVFIWYVMDALKQQVKEFEKENEVMVRCILYYECTKFCFRQFSVNNKAPHRMTNHPTQDDMLL